MILGDFSACVFIDDQELLEYDVIVSSTPTENRTTCWIASEEGKKFGIRWKILAQQSSGVRSVVSVDGVRCGRQTVPSGWIGTKERTSQARRDFMFSNIDFTDDDAILDDQNANDIGQIALEVKTGEYVKANIVKHSESKNHTLGVQEGKVHERSKKAHSHRVALGYPRQMARRSGHAGDVTSYTIIPDDHPATVFMFKYTRLDVLQAMGIAPSATKSSVDEETENHDDEIEVFDGPDLPSKDIKPRIEQLETELLRLRAQLASSEDRKPSRVKLECGGSRRQPTFTNEILDLTED
ncbi:hypothetical protein DEU56DRAFT_789516 [Suillus clintonianus]|uniref:uncharacterized protein n=1 Tax=Suillus clintonianus TaxID=1904413 RepID=UPI001B8620B9|nr:uncharacterized protein DEU56DRAFT_789516 [Suillus clintonianus]KAG2145222.1 hypothetical protein DEU56DRAFT_789516 [Suillus clintonianus]